MPYICTTIYALLAMSFLALMADTKARNKPALSTTPCVLMPTMLLASLTDTGGMLSWCTCMHALSGCSVINGVFVRCAGTVAHQCRCRERCIRDACTQGLRLLRFKHTCVPAHSVCMHVASKRASLQGKWAALPTGSQLSHAFMKACYGLVCARFKRAH